MPVDRMKRVVFVLGMHRSGTSSLAGALNACGVWLGDDLIGADPGINAKGYWEHRELVHINEALLEACGQRWFYPEASRAVLKHLEGGVDQDCLHSARRFVDQVPLRDRIFAIKDPRLCLTAPFWYERFREQGFEVSVIHLLRSHREVARSLEKRDSIRPAHSNALWLDYVGAAEAFICDYPVGFVRTGFDAFLANPVAEMESLVDEANLPFTIDNKKLSAWVEPALRHHRVQDTEVDESWRGKHAESVMTALSGARSQRTVCDIDSPYRWSIEERSILQDLVKMFEHYNRTLIQLQESVRHVEELGALHDKALARIRELDQGVTHLASEKKVLESEKEELDGELTLAQQIISSRDEELQLIESLLGPIGRYRFRRLKTED